MEEHINSTSLNYNKKGFTTGIVFRIQEYILFSYRINNKSNLQHLNIIFPSGILNWNYVAQYIIDQLNEYSIRYSLDTLFSYELSNSNLRIKANLTYTGAENSITFLTSRINMDVNKLFLNFKPSTNILFQINTSVNDYFLYCDFTISNIYNLNDLYLLTTYHNIDNNTLQQKVVCKYKSDNNIINETILDFTIIGFDIPSDTCISKYSNINTLFSIHSVISNYFTWTQDNVWFHFSNNRFIIDKNSKNQPSSFMYYPQLLPIGSDIYLIGNSEHDNNSVNSGLLADNSFTGLYGDKPIVESLLLNCSSFKGYSGGPTLINMITDWNIDYVLNDLRDICQSFNGEIIYAITVTLGNFYLYKSTNYGKTFVNITFPELNIVKKNNNVTDTTILINICCDESGLYSYISISKSGIYFSKNQGITWTQKKNIQNTINCIDCSTNGNSFYACENGNNLIYSNNYGDDTLSLNLNQINVNTIKISDTKIVAIESLGFLYVSDINNINFVAKINDKKRLWSSVDIKNGIICATTEKGEVFISNDNGISFTKILTLPLLNYKCVSMDKNGQHIFISGNSFNDNINIDLLINSDTPVKMATRVSGTTNNYFLVDDIKLNSSYIYISDNSGKNWRKEYSTDMKYIFDKILISGDYKRIIGKGNYNIAYEQSITHRYFLRTSINSNNYKIIGMLVGGASDNIYYENICISISFHIIHIILQQIYYKYSLLDDNTKNDMNLLIKYVLSGFPKVYLGIKYNHFNHSDLIKNPSLITIFNNNKIFGGLWINDFIKGFNFIQKKFIYDILEPEKKDTISIQNPLINTKLWKIFHQDLLSSYPILLTKIIYFNYWIRDNLLLELGKFNISKLNTQYDYYDVNRERNDTISFVKSEYFSSQRSISDFIYFYYWDILSGLSSQRDVYPDFVVEYIYFDIKKQIWTLGAEKVSPFLTDTREYSIKYPVLLYGYEKVNTLYEFSSK